MTHVTGEALERAALALEGVARGAALDRTLAMEAAQTLRTYADHTQDMDLLDAAAGLERLATGGKLPLDSLGRRLAAELAELVRAEASELKLGKNSGRKETLP
jgi:hypothetical protein